MVLIALILVKRSNFKVVNDYANLRKVYNIINHQSLDTHVDQVEVEVKYLRDRLLDYGSRIHSISLDKSLDVQDLSEPLKSSFVNSWIADYQNILQNGFPADENNFMANAPNISSEISQLELQVEKLKANGSLSLHQKIGDINRLKLENPAIESQRLLNVSTRSAPKNYPSSISHGISRGTNTSLLSRDIDILEEHLMSMALSVGKKSDKSGSNNDSTNEAKDIISNKFYDTEYPTTFSDSVVNEEIAACKSSLSTSHTEPSKLIGLPILKHDDLPLDVLDLAPNQESQPNVDAFIQGLTKSNEKRFEEHSTISHHEDLSISVRDPLRIDGHSAFSAEVTGLDEFAESIQQHTHESKSPIQPENGKANLSREANTGVDSFFLQNSQIVVPSMKSRMTKAIQLVNRHLVFGFDQQSTDYFQIYKNGLLCGRLAGTSCSNTHQAIVKPLHPLLKDLFLLDNHILSELLKDFDLPSINVEDSSDVQLSDWIIGLESLHRHFSPISKSIFQMEGEMKVSLRIEEAMIIVRDYISLAKITQSSLLREDEVSKLHSTMGDINVSSSRVMGSMIKLSSSFSNWLQVLLDD